jgi:hypothetical protein
VDIGTGALSLPADAGGTPLVVLLDAPDTAGAHMLQTGEAANVQAALTSWIADAESTLERWRAAPDEVVLAEGCASAALAAIRHRWPKLTGNSADGAVLTDETPEVDPTLVASVRRAARHQPGFAKLTAALADAGLVFNTRSLTTGSEVCAPALDAGPKPTAVADIAFLQQCLSDAQQELEATYLRLHATTSELAARSLLTGNAVRQASALLDWNDPATPDASVKLTVRELEIAGVRRLPRARAELRLGDGEPELFLFAAGTEPEILSAWRPDGSTLGLARMRFRPADEESRKQLQHLGSADWQVVFGIALLMQREIDRVADVIARPWRIAMTRLRRQMAALPRRFRYDSLRVIDDPLGGQGLELEFDGASFGLTALQPVRLHWSDARLYWALEASAVDLPLVSWPLGRDGVPAVRWTVPVGDAGLDARGKQAAWRAMPDDDRVLVLAVLDALPALADRASDIQAGRWGGRAALSAAAAQPLREALRLLSQDRQRLRLARIPGLRWLRR